MSVQSGYGDLEERLNALTHGVATFISLVGFVMLLLKSSEHDNLIIIIAAAIYGATMVGAFLTSTIYHLAGDSPRRDLYKLIDHVAIYFKISGGFTIYALVLLPYETGIWLMLWTWSATALGCYLKFSRYMQGRTRRFSWMSLAFYLAIGWGGVLIIDQIYELMPRAGFYWLLSGAIAYTLGTIFYAMKSVRYTHAIWHMFVVVGSFCVFVSVYEFII